MASTDQLLQELIDLQKEDMRRTRRYRTTRIIVSTLPIVIFIILTVWGSIVLYQSVLDGIKNLPEFLQQHGLENLNTRL